MSPHANSGFAFAAAGNEYYVFALTHDAVTWKGSGNNVSIRYAPRNGFLTGSGVAAARYAAAFI